MSGRQNVRSPDGSLRDRLQDAAALALDHAGRMGAGMSEVSVAQGQGLSVSVRNGEVETIEHHRDKSLGITVYFGHRSGSSSSSDLSEAAIRESVQSAANIARHTEEDAFNGLADPGLMAADFPDLDLYHPWGISAEEAIDLAARCEGAALAHDARITNTEGADLSTYEGLSLYANSHGFSGFVQGSRHSSGCAVIAGTGDGMQRDYWYDSRRSADDLAPPESIGRQAVDRTVRRIGARTVATGEYPVAYESTVASSLLSHLVAAISGAGLYRKASFLNDCLGKQVFARGIDIFEEPHLARGPGSAGFDAEGVATRPNRIVSDGVLGSYVLDSYTARKLGLQTTANAGGVHNLTLGSTQPGGVDEIAGLMGRGVLVTELIGFGVNTVTGDYSRGAFGYWVEGGQVQYPVQQFTVAGNLKEMFMGIQAVGSDIDARGNIRTGSILIGNATIAGD